jgi:hypothetical protein
VENMVDANLVAPCGLYCGTCRQYLAWKKDKLEEKGLKLGCKGCRVRNKKCAFIRRNCLPLLKNEIEFCYECQNFPCEKLDDLNDIYVEKYSVDLVNNLKRIKEVGVDKWLQEQEELYNCPECGGQICIHDSVCYDCNYKINPNIK